VKALRVLIGLSENLLMISVNSGISFEEGVWVISDDLNENRGIIGIKHGKVSGFVTDLGF
jgi:hypothetical protein